jgi:hypothetical protein
MTNQSVIMELEPPLPRVSQTVYWLADPEKEKVMELTAEHGGKYSAEFHNQCTHLICGISSATGPALMKHVSWFLWSVECNASDAVVTFFLFGF